ncbi:hypothetical protein EV182_002138 [Spiromyces aspiralis]|uniref:Uncharacterized protein n=1 Tax=Spiromyces aspiralis TaxID=68401 RepID=A0ACC1HG49_9FUNG|nr:hypothetical protein EV182_002138 [Spiromyces aspiralis]
MQAKALYACQADNPGELSFSEGDIILEVVESGEPGWLLGTLAKTHERGLFPEVYVELSSFQPGDEELKALLCHNVAQGATVRVKTAPGQSPKRFGSITATTTTHKLEAADTKRILFARFCTPIPV